MPALLLKDGVNKELGRKKSGLYSGKAMVVRCGDGNPRRIIGILNRFLILLLHKEGAIYSTKNTPLIPKGKQQEILQQDSRSILQRIKSEPRIGPELFKFIDKLGTYMSENVHKRLVSTDQISSIRIDHDIDDKKWEIISCAVTLGLLYPNKNKDNPDYIPDRQGMFHLAYVLAPHFKILPRRETARSLNSFTDIETPTNDQQLGLL